MTPLQSVFPWIPAALSKVLQVYYGAKVHTTFKKVVERRRDQGLKDSDPVDFMIEKGDTVQQMITFLLGATFAGLVNTSRVLGWLLIYLWAHPEWKSKIQDELHGVLTEHAGHTKPSAMHGVPFEAWESALPSLEACMFELIRLKGDGALLRKNVGEDFLVDGRNIQSGRFVAYLMSDIHHNPLIHPNPDIYEPARKPAASAQGITFIGFGAGMCRTYHRSLAHQIPGRHPCIGKEMAILLTKLVISNLLLKFEYDIVDGKGSTISIIPPSEKNSLHMPGLEEGHTVRARFRARASCT
ncbi:cytochrome P450 [Mycena haematopus]|nr:cytochrome P450 [Mycena haematopus]